MLRSRRLLNAVLALLFAASPASVYLAQESGDAAARPEGPKADEVVEEQQPSAVIPVSDITRQVEQTTLRLREIRDFLAPDPRLVELKGELERNAEALDQLQERTRELLARPRSLRSLDNVRQQCSLRLARLDDWEAGLKRRSQSSEDRRTALRQMQETWGQTVESLTKEEVPQALIERTNTLLERISEVEKELAERQESVLTLQNMISEQRIELNESLLQLDAARAQIRHNLLLPDSAPLWSDLFAGDADERLFAQLAESWATDQIAVRELYLNYKHQLQAHLSAFFALLLLTILLRRRATEWVKDDKTLEFSAHVLDRPVSASLLLALTFTYFIYPRAPITIYELNALVIMLPLLRLLPGLVFRAMRPPLYGLIAVLVFFQLHKLVLDDSLLQRLLLLLVTAAALAGLVWVQRPGGPATRTDGGPWWRAAVGFSRLGFLTFGGSLVANLIGNVELAALLTGATLSSARVAIVLFAGALVVDGLITVALRTRLAQSLNAVRKHGELLKRRGMAAVHLAAGALWIWATLTLFQLYGPIFDWAGALLGRGWQVGTVEISLGGVLAFLFTIWVAFQLSRFLRFVLEEDVLPRFVLARGVPGAISSLTHYVILGLGFVLALAAAGIQLDRFTLLAGAFGVGVGFGLQTVVNNFVSGLILMFERPIQVGDTIEIGSLLGTVRQIGIRASVVRTFTGAEVIVPNGNLVAGEVVNWTLSDRLRRVEVNAGVAYGTDPKQVLELLVAAARQQPDVLEYPEPLALFNGFGESSLDFELRFWTSNFDNWRKVGSAVTVAVHDALKEAGIEIPFPQRDLHLRSVDPMAGRVATERLEVGRHDNAEESS